MRSILCMRVVFVLVLAGGVAAAGAAAADVVTFQEGDGGLYSTTDGTYIDLNAPDTNFGDDPYLLFYKVFNVQIWRVAHLRFPDVIGNNVGQIPIGSTILSASLQMIPPNNLSEVNVHEVLKDWDEATMTWSNWSGPGVVGVDVTGVVAGHPGGPSLVPVTFDVTSIVQNWALGMPNYGVQFRKTGLDGNFRFYSDDYTVVGYRPKLSVEFEGGSLPVAPSTWGAIKSIYE